jgi:hypothetical protein
VDQHARQQREQALLSRGARGATVGGMRDQQRGLDQGAQHEVRRASACAAAQWPRHGAHLVRHLAAGAGEPETFRVHVAGDARRVAHPAVSLDTCVSEENASDFPRHDVLDDAPLGALPSLDAEAGSGEVVEWVAQ